MSYDFDVLVIGSGFGGSVAALRLTEKGYRVLVVEAGARFEDQARRIAELLGFKLTKEELAQRLFLGPATVKTHVSNILAKTGSRDRVQAVVLGALLRIAEAPAGEEIVSVARTSASEPPA